MKSAVCTVADVAGVPVLATAKATRAGPTVTTTNVAVVESIMCTIITTALSVAAEMSTSAAIRVAIDCLRERPIRTRVDRTATQTTISMPCSMPAILAAF